MRRAAPILCLLFAAISCARAANSAAVPAPSARLAGWVVADLDGDSHADLAVSAAGRPDGRSYLQEITFHFSASQDSAITVRTLLRVVRLSVQDLDGDADRDVVLESFTREPLAVLLNDGDGHFHQGDLNLFRNQLAHRTSLSIEQPELESPCPEWGECPNHQPVAIGLPTDRPDLSAVCLTFRLITSPLIASASDVASRGPPRRTSRG